MRGVVGLYSLCGTLFGNYPTKRRIILGWRKSSCRPGCVRWSGRWHAAAMIRSVLAIWAPRWSATRQNMRKYKKVFFKSILVHMCNGIVYPCNLDNCWKFFELKLMWWNVCPTLPTLVYRVTFVYRTITIEFNFNSVKWKLRINEMRACSHPFITVCHTLASPIAFSGNIYCWQTFPDAFLAKENHLNVAYFATK